MAESSTLYQFRSCACGADPKKACSECGGLRVTVSVGEIAALQIENARLREALRKIMEGSEDVRHEGLVEATRLVLVEKNSTPTIRVKDLEHEVSCGIFAGSVSCNCGALLNAVKEHPGGSA